MGIVDMCRDCGRLKGFSSDPETIVCERCLRVREAQPAPVEKKKDSNNENIAHE